jgi:integrase
MGTITPRVGANGITKYKAQVRIRRGGVIIHQETQTFDRRASAVAWAKKRETELSAPEGIDKAKADDPTLGQAIRKYLDESTKEIKGSKRKALTLIEKSDLGKMPCSHVTSTALVKFGRDLGRAPVTVAGYMTHLKSVFAVAKVAWGYPLSKSTMDEAVGVLRELGVVGTSDRRDRRPSLDEIGRIIESLYTKWLESGRTIAPYHLIVLFAIFSTRRQGEITRMKWSDFDESACRLLVFDMKDPKKKIGNHVYVDLTPEALQVVRAAPRLDDTLVFPVANNTVSTEFKEACEALHIADLRFHDLRHEGVSRLFELGMSIPAVSMMSGHKTWIHLKRYAHIRAFGDKYAGWKWLDLVAPLPQRQIPHS